jgi:flagellin-like protein
MKNFARSKKALSPVVASIILIAVTVAVSIAVAAWMGALTIGFMQTEEVKVTGVNFAGGKCVISVANQGTNGVTISAVSINGNPVTATAALPTLSANGQAQITIDPYSTTSGNNYEVKIQTTKGNYFMYNAVA